MEGDIGEEGVPISASKNLSDDSTRVIFEGANEQPAQPPIIPNIPPILPQFPPVPGIGEGESESTIRKLTIPPVGLNAQLNGKADTTAHTGNPPGEPNYSKSFSDDRKKRDQTPSCEVLGYNLSLSNVHTLESPTIKSPTINSPTPEGVEGAQSIKILSKAKSPDTPSMYQTPMGPSAPSAPRAKMISTQTTAIDKFVGYSAEVNRFFENIFNNVGLQISRYPCFMLTWVVFVQAILAWGCVTIGIELDVFSLILGEDSITFKTGEWKKTYLADSSWANASLASNETDEQSSEGGLNFFIVQGARLNEGNMMEPQYILAMREFMKQFFTNWTTSCPEFPGAILGYRDLARWDHYDANYAAVAEFPLDFIDPIGCFMEGNWTYPENSKKVLDRLPELGFEKEWAQKGYSLLDIQNQSTGEEEMRTKTSEGIMSCWKYIKAYDARVPFFYLIGGMEFPRNDTAMKIGDYAMYNTKGIEWEPAYLLEHDKSAETFTVYDAVTKKEKLGVDVTLDRLRKAMTSFTAIQSIGYMVGKEEFAKRIQTIHYGYCETTGDLNGKFDCSNDDHYEQILEKAPNCYKKVVEDLGEAMRTSIKKGNWEIDFALLHPYDAESIVAATGESAVNQLIVAVCIMITFIFIIAWNPFTPAQSKSIVGACAVPLVCLSTMAGMGLCQLVMRFDFTPRTMQVLPFLGVGLGVDDVLVLLWTYSYQREYHKIQDEMSRAMTIAGVSISLTSLTNLISFIIGTMMPLNELALFATVAAFVQVTNYVAVVFGFGSMLVLDNRRRAVRTRDEKGSTRMSSYCADRKSSIIQDWRLEGKQKPLGYRKIKNISKEMFKVIPSCFICWFAIFILCLCAYGAFHPGPELGESISDYIPDGHGLASYFYYYEKYFTTAPAEFGVGYSWENGKPHVYMDDHFSAKWSDIKNYYDSIRDLDTIVLLSTWAETFEKWVTTKPAIDAEGLPDEDPNDIVMRGYHPSTGWPEEPCVYEESNPKPYAACGELAQAREYKCIGDYECSLVDKVLEYCSPKCTTCQGLINELIFGYNYECGLLPIECQEMRYGGGKCFSQEGDLYNYVGRAGVCFEPPTDEDATNDYWYTEHETSYSMNDCMDWCNRENECIGFAYWYKNNTDNTAGCRLFDVVGGNCTSVNANITMNRGIISLWKAAINESAEVGCTQGYEDWDTDMDYQEKCFIELLQYWVLNIASGQRLSTEIFWSNGGHKPDKNDYLVATKSSSLISTGAMGGALDGSMIIDSMVQSRGLFKEYSSAEIGPWTSSILYDLYDQFMEVDKYLWTSLAYIAFSIFLCSLIFILHPVAATILLFCLFCTLMEIYGVLYFADININGMLALNLVVACGITVEFTAHINRHFMLANGNPNYRMANSLGNMFLPVTLGALTTVLAVSFMAFSDIQYTRVYYFRLFVIITGFGWFNGVFLQSALLSIAATIFKNTILDLETISIDAPIDLDQQYDTVRGDGVPGNVYGFLEDNRKSSRVSETPQPGKPLRGGTAPAKRRNSIERNISPIRGPAKKNVKSNTDVLYSL